MSAILFYDASCELCRLCKEAVEAASIEPPAFVPNTDIRSAVAAGVDDIPQLNRRMCLVTPGRQPLWGYQAIIGLLQLRDPSHFLARLLSLPVIRHIGNRVYDFVASRRSCSSGNSR